MSAANSIPMAAATIGFAPPAAATGGVIKLYERSEFYQIFLRFAARLLKFVRNGDSVKQPNEVRSLGRPLTISAAERLKHTRSNNIVARQLHKLQQIVFGRSGDGFSLGLPDTICNTPSLCVGGLRSEGRFDERSEPKLCE